MRAAAEKLPFLSKIGDEDGVMTLSNADDCGCSAKPVMQSMTRTLFDPDFPEEGSMSNSDSVVRGFCTSSDIWITVNS